MASVKVTVDLEIDGRRAPGYPIARRVEVDEIQQFDVTRATGGGYVASPSSDIASAKVVLLHPSQAVTVRLDGQSDAGIELAAGGLLVVADAIIDAGAATNVTISNASGVDVQVEGMVAG